MKQERSRKSPTPNKPELRPVKNSGCKYCTDEFEFWHSHEENQESHAGTTVYLEVIIFHVELPNFKKDYYKFRYCPMCGRKFEVQDD